MMPGVPQSDSIIVILTSHPASVEELRKTLEQAGYRTALARSFEHAAATHGGEKVHLIMLDRLHFPLNRSRPGLPAFATCLYVSFWPPPQGCTEEQFLRDLEAGIDDVLSGETNRQIIAKVRALLRRRNAEVHVSKILTVGSLQMDLDKHEVKIEGKIVELTPKEFAILHCFLQAPGLAFSRQAMLSRVWGEEYALDQHALDVHVHALRHKIEKNPARPALIVTVRGLGYKLKMQ